MMNAANSTINGKAWLPLRWRQMPLAASVATSVLAFGVAAAIDRPAPRFAAPPIAVVRDAAGHALWSIRVSAAAHEIAVDALNPAPRRPAGDAYQLWLTAPRGPRSLGLLPLAGRKVIPEIPALVARLIGADAGTDAARLVVSREPEGGSPAMQPSGPIVFRAAIASVAAAPAAATQ
jgi:anti-sigma-K factor RskA